jgi:hypothetical protein
VCTKQTGVEKVDFVRTSPISIYSTPWKYQDVLRPLGTLLVERDEDGCCTIRKPMSHTSVSQDKTLETIRNTQATTHS